ncbi:MAG: replication-associated recombination protein A [Candidatus Marinimicrobia bacterium]|jgi:putative ATPase|nr:replication-associated recombination protein A [Candidatus Neomarinimicrobiota bacterium]MBT3631221.1 replication-associated recombination protein A [Candidatus Neomarinimicrobiota bacterium]MBT3824729.1 replication-associated recombination protein A [Candidatus Neomarinimicrobiota bacterium]MBT4131653.1 replication-associated recombination protein A [Candidatus Neomarinimicrobiota bacterium]MBT4296122.1 replication-associated recombination protein A [Candidatus Neomarinimicrobiota bacterium
MSLFNNAENPRTLPPLAERMRPNTLAAFLGQQHLVAENRLLAKAIKADRLFSIILWGPPGCGKTTLAKIIASQVDAHFYELSAVSSGVKDVRAAMAKAKANRELGKPSILFIDEIHRFNKAQQDALLQAVENGIITLIGATTENPSFEVISPLLSRCQVLKLTSHSKEDLASILEHALSEDLFLSTQNIQFEDKGRDLLLESVSGDARRLLNALEISTSIATPDRDEDQVITITDEHIREALQNKHQLYDKTGDYHYDIISAFIKSVRGSDPDASLYWLSVMLEGGEDPIFIARRLVILASEDVGNADPQALTLATSGLQAVHAIGMPEGAIVLSQVTTYLASTTKSNASYMALRAAQETVREEGAHSVPLHLRNAPTSLMKEQGHGKGYHYPHNYPGHFSEQDYFPDELKARQYYRPSTEGIEKRIYERLVTLWASRFEEPSGS